MQESAKYRALAVGSLLGALTHVLAPRALLAGVEWWYSEWLKADFEASEATIERVRWLAVPNALAAVYFWKRSADSDST
jgi:hypothetical protein